MKSSRARELGGGDALVVGGVEPAVADVVHDGAGEQVHVLQDHAERTAQVGLLDLVDVDAVVADLAVGDVVEAVDQVRDGRLARAGGADEGDLLAGLRVHAYMPWSTCLSGRVAEVDVVHADIALRAGCRSRCRPLCGCFQAQTVGALVALDELAVALHSAFTSVDVALVGFRLLVDAAQRCARRRQGP